MSWVYALLTAFITVVVTCPVLIPFLRYLKFGQNILKDGPAWHSSKQGTPTMGGITMILGCIAAFILTGVTFHKLTIFVCALLFGMIGFADDFIKIVQKRNLGLTPVQKFSAQAAVSLAFVLFLQMFDLNGELLVPFMSVRLNLGIFYIPFAVFVVLAVVNSVNLTDGLDGLAASVTAVVALFFSLAAHQFGMDDVAVLMAAGVGGCLGFLIHNAYPARIFMGDTGSLLLGGLVAGVATVLHMQLFVLICGIIYFIEACSVIIQVLVYKKTHRRVFKMAPIHHHFELSQWRENKIVSYFTVITIAMCLLSYVALI